MARVFTGGAGSNFSLSQGVATVRPFTLMAWVKRASLGNTGVCISLVGGAADDADYLELTAADANAASNDWGTAADKKAMASNLTDFVHMAAVFASNTSREVFVNGVASGISAVNIAAPAGINSLRVACYNEFVGQFVAATMAEIAVWNVALATEEIAGAAKGISPKLIRPQSLKLYIPAIRALQELQLMTVFNTSGGSVGDHPRTYGG